MTLAPRKFSGEKWPRNRAVGDAFESKADAGPIADSGLTAPPLTLLGNPRSDDNEPVTPLTVEGDTEFDAENNVFRVLADARRSLGLGQFATTTSDELRGVLDDETGTGSAVFSDTPTLTTPAVIGRITRNGHWVTPYINAQADHGASGIGGEDQTSAIANAIKEANETGRELIFPPGYYDAVYFPEITTSGVSIRGHGQNATYIRHTASSGSTLRFTGQFPSVRDLTMWPLAYKSSGAEIEFLGTYRGSIENVLSQYHYNAFNIISCAAPQIVGSTTLYAHGDAHIAMSGSAGAVGAGLYVDRHSANNPWPVDPTSFKAWALSTSYTAGQFFYENSWCWVCTVGGTTAGSGALAPDTSSSYSWAINDVTHGSARFRALCRTNMSGILQDSYAYSVTIAGSHFINGAYGYAMLDSANTGTSYPQWMTSFDLETDHAFFAGVLALGGLTIDLGAGAWIGSTLAGNAVTLASAFKGSFNMIGARVAGNLQHGVYMGAGEDNSILGCRFTGNGASASGVFSDILVDAGVSDWNASFNTFGSENGVGATALYGVNIASGASNNYTVAHNRAQGLTSGQTVSDGGTGTSKSIFRNLPIAAEFVGSFGTTVTVAASTTDLVVGNASGVVVTLPPANVVPGKRLTIRNISTGAVTSASANIIPKVGGAAGTALFTGVPGETALLIPDGTNWQVQL